MPVLEDVDISYASFDPAFINWSGFAFVLRIPHPW